MRSLLVAAVLISTVTNPSRAEDTPLPLTAPFDATQAKAAQVAWAKSLGKSSPVEKNSIGMDLVLIPPGRFRMGSSASEKDRSRNEAQVDVTLTKAFYLGKMEVTQEQWRAVMNTTPWKGKQYVREGDNVPATCMTWGDAMEFCKLLGEKEKVVYRLPSDAEWEYACRAGTSTRFCFGDDEKSLSDFAWWGGFIGDGNAKSEKHAHEVGQKKPNSFGLHDMSGNVYEWCLDDYTDKCPGGADPLVSLQHLSIVYRGGGWGFKAADCRSAARFEDDPSGLSPTLGFRVVRKSVQ